MQEDFLWTEKYRPKTVADTILPQDLKRKFQKFVDQKNVPNLILAGSSGVGKTTIARAMLDNLGCQYLMVNGSMDGGIEKLRTDIQTFASMMSLQGGRKYVILDEADYLTQNTQPALRNFMETFSKNCGFILTCNHKNRIIKELHSRSVVVDFAIPPDERAALAKQFMERAEYILNTEGVVYDIKVIAALIKKHFPDWRRIIGILQYESTLGEIDTRALSNLHDVYLRDLIKFMKEKNYTAARKWVADNGDIDSAEFYRKFYDALSEIVDAKEIPYLVVITSKYLYQDAFAADKEINTAAFLAEVMASGSFK